MGATDLTAVLRRKPFEPFRLVTSDGTTYEIRHPDLIWVTMSSAMVGFPDPSHPDVPSRYDIISLRHIIRIEQLLEEAKTG